MTGRMGLALQVLARGAETVFFPGDQALDVRAMHDDYEHRNKNRTQAYIGRRRAMWRVTQVHQQRQCSRGGDRAERRVSPEPDHQQPQDCCCNNSLPADREKNTQACSHALPTPEPQPYREYVTDDSSHGRSHDPMSVASGPARGQPNCQIALSCVQQQCERTLNWPSVARYVRRTDVAAANRANVRPALSLHQQQPERNRPQKIGGTDQPVRSHAGFLRNG
jgi:hypothetical protein